VGGVVGRNEDPGSIISSYHSGVGGVTGSGLHIGGLVGFNEGEITRSYNTSKVLGPDNVGGIAGTNEGDIEETYSSGLVIGFRSAVGALVGEHNSGSITNSYWDTGTSVFNPGDPGIGVISGGGLTSVAGFSTPDLLQESNYTGFNFSNDWFLISGETRPFLRVEYSTTIHNDHQLQMMALDVTADYVLANSIDLSGIIDPAQHWATSLTSGKGFVPISGSSFSGSLDGAGHAIFNLFINRTTEDNIGLFSITDSSASITDVGLVDTDIRGQDAVGGLVGSNAGSIIDAFSSGVIEGGIGVGGLVGTNSGSLSLVYSSGEVIGNVVVGGLVGSNSNAINDSYSTASVTGNVDTGGLVGEHSGSIDNAYSSGFVDGNINKGGFIGNNSGTVSDSFFDENTSGTTSKVGTGDASGIDGKSTSDLLDISTYDNTGAGWDITDVPGSPGAQVWFIIDDETRPFLQSEYSTEIHNAHELQLIALDLTAEYQLVADIDMSSKFRPTSPPTVL